uniref:FAD-binding protein n=1 Tax=Lichenicoccus roseus TaxID=2683649 RepID=UPI001980EB9C
MKPHGLWFPVDVFTASRATIGGRVGNNACGGGWLPYGTTRDNVVDPRRARRRHADAVRRDRHRCRQPRLGGRAVGICNFGSFHTSVRAAQKSICRNMPARVSPGRAAVLCPNLMLRR